MSLAGRAQRFLVDVNRPGNMFRSAWDRLRGVPGGKAVFSRLAGEIVPYTGTIAARFEDLRTGYARITMPDRRRLRNHLNCVHAVALVNLAELTGNAAMAYSLPEGARFIVARMEIEYLKKARGPITAESNCPVPPDPATATYQIPVTLRDQNGDEVARAIIDTLVGPRDGPG